MKAFPKECKWCNKKPFRRAGRIHLCKKHYRFQQMRVDAKRQGKLVPEYDDLNRYLSMCDMTCSCCNREMNWTAIEGQSTVITLQHNNDGTMNFLCRSCNTLHGKIGDVIYKVGDNEKYCSSCDFIKDLEDFYKDKHKVNGYKSYCKKCSNRKLKKYRNQNRDKYNEYQREYRARQ